MSGILPRLRNSIVVSEVGTQEQSSAGPTMLSAAPLPSDSRSFRSRGEGRGGVRVARLYLHYLVLETLQIDVHLGRSPDGRYIILLLFALKCQLGSANGPLGGMISIKGCNAVNFLFQLISRASGDNRHPIQHPPARPQLPPSLTNLLSSPVDWTADQCLSGCGAGVTKSSIIDRCQTLTPALFYVTTDGVNRGKLTVSSPHINQPNSLFCFSYEIHCLTSPEFNWTAKLVRLRYSVYRQE